MPSSVSFSSPSFGNLPGQEHLRQMRHLDRHQTAHLPEKNCTDQGSGRLPPPGLIDQDIRHHRPRPHRKQRQPGGCHED